MNIRGLLSLGAAVSLLAVPSIGACNKNQQQCNKNKKEYVIYVNGNKVASSKDNNCNSNKPSSSCKPSTGCTKPSTGCNKPSTSCKPSVGNGSCTKPSIGCNKPIISIIKPGCNKPSTGTQKPDNDTNIDIEKPVTKPNEDTQVQVPSAPVEKPVEKPEVEKPAEKPVEKPETQKPVEKPNTENNNQAQAGNFSEFQQEVLNLVNKERTSRGLSPLTLNAKLSNVATLKSQDMVNKHYFDHQSPTYGSPFDMMKQFGISYRTAGENIAMGQRTPKEVMNSWMNSSGHRANILNSSYKELGVGIAKDANGRLYWTQQFIG